MADYAELLLNKSQPQPAPTRGKDYAEALLAPASDPMANQRAVDYDVPAPTFLESMGRGFADYTEGAEQIARQATGRGAEAFTREKSADLALYEQGREQRGDTWGIDWGRVVGNAIASTPLMAIPGGAATGMVRRGAAGMAGGAAGAGLQFVEEGGSRSLRTVLGGALGVGIGIAAPYAVEAVKRGAKGLWEAVAGRTVNPRATQAVDSVLSKILPKQTSSGASNQLTPPNFREQLIAEVDDAMRQGTQYTDEQLQRLVEMRAVGANPMKANITRTPEDWATMENLRGMPKTGAPINTRIVENANALVKYTEGLKAQTGGRANTAYEAGNSVIEAVQTKSREMQREVGKLYEQVRTQVGDDIGLVPGRLVSKLDELSDDAAADPFVDSVRRRLVRFGLIDKDGKLTGAAATVRQAEELRKWIGGLSDKGDPAIKRVKALTTDALDDDVIDTAGVDAFKTARDAARARFAEFEQGVLGKTAAGDLSPDDFVRKHVMSAKVDDLKAMKNTLTKGTPEQAKRGTEAWNDARGWVVTDLLMKATGAQSPEDVAGRMFSGAKFKAALDAIGPEKKAILFSADEMKSLRTLVKASEYLTSQVPGSAVNYSRSGSVIMEYLSGALSKIPLLASLASGNPAPAAVAMGAQAAGKAMANRKGASALAEQLGGLPSAAPKQVKTSRVSRVLPGSSAGVANQTGDD